MSQTASLTGGTQIGLDFRRIRRKRMAADLLLAMPLIIFLLLVFALPIISFMYRAIDNSVLHAAFPNTQAALSDWRAPDDVPEDAFAALAMDLRAIPSSVELAVVARHLNNFQEGFRSLLMKSANQLPPEPAGSWRETFAAIDARWSDTSRWAVMKHETRRLTSGFILAAVDLRLDDNGSLVRVAPERRLYIPLLLRTYEISISVALLCLLLAYPTAYVLTRMPPRAVGLMMFCVMLPFWTSLLVRTTAWIILLQGNGPINGVLEFAGIIQKPLELIFNRFGTLVAMSHVLLPYMILPLYSAMRAIPSSHMMAAQSLGANRRTAFLRVYLPQTISGIGAGLLLVFILALGYYITPALVGGPGDQMVSYMITYNVNKVVNWGMASALGLMLLLTTVVLLLALSRVVRFRQVLG